MRNTSVICDLQEAVRAPPTKGGEAGSSEKEDTSEGGGGVRVRLVTVGKKKLPDVRKHERFYAYVSEWELGREGEELHPAGTSLTACTVWKRRPLRPSDVSHPVSG